MFFKNYFLKDKIKKNSYFIWNNESKNIQFIKNYRPLKLDLIIGVDSQKKILLNNTYNFAEGNFTNNALLWGARGTVNKVADNKEMQVQVSENVEIKIAPGMVADLYTSPETQKKQPVNENQIESVWTVLFCMFAISLISIKN